MLVASLIASLLGWLSEPLRGWQVILFVLNLYAKLTELFSVRLNVRSN